MDCYVCACEGKEKRAVALCHHCSVGVCIKHLEELQNHNQGGMRYTCNHGVLRPPKLTATSTQP